MPPLFSKLSERKPDHLDYIGVSYGLTQPLHKFWKRHSFAPVYLRQTPNELTGEHSCVMLKPLSKSTTTDSSWLSAYAQDFHKRFLTLLSYQFRTFASVQALSISESASRATKSPDKDTSNPATTLLTKHDLDIFFSPFDLARLDSYANNLLDYHVILDLLPPLAQLYFTGRLKAPPCNVTLSGVQQSILLAIGLQRKDLSDVERELNLPSNQLLAMFVKVLRKISTALRGVVGGEIEAALGGKPDVNSGTEALSTGLSMGGGRVNVKPLVTADQENGDDDIDEDVDPAIREKQRALIDALPLDKYEISTTTAKDAAGAEDQAWEDAERQVRQGAISSVVSVKNDHSKSKKRKVDDGEGIGEGDLDGRDGDDADESKKERKRGKQKQGKKSKSDGERKDKKRKSESGGKERTVRV